MATLIENTFTTTAGKEPVIPRRSKAAGGSAGVLLPWLRAQSINVTRHAAALRPFKADEFGIGAEAPTAGHIQAVNKLITGLRSGLLKHVGKVSKTTTATHQDPSAGSLAGLDAPKGAAPVGARHRENLGFLF